MSKTKQNVNATVNKKSDFDKKKLELLKNYIKTARELGRYPNLVELDVSRHDIKYYFKTKENLENDAEERSPALFRKFFDPKIYNNTRHNKLQKTIKNYNRFVIVTAVAGHAVQINFLNSMRHYCKVNDALLLILISANDLSGDMDSEILKEHIVYSDMVLNDKLLLSTLKITPKQINPTTGLLRFASNGGSIIFASPKMAIDYKPTIGKKNLPNTVATTGAVTMPNYNYDDRRYDQKRTTAIAENDHYMGALIVELESSKKFHIRPIEMCTKGGFIDLGMYYETNQHAPCKASAIVYGDIHAGEHDKSALKCFQKLNELVKADSVVLHDLFNGGSINHHENKDTAIRTRKQLAGKLDLLKELIEYTDQINYFTEMYNKVIIVKSNHDTFIDKFLSSGKYAPDLNNNVIGGELFVAFIKSLYNKNPLEWFARDHPKSTLKHPKRVAWLIDDDSTTLEGWSIGLHGSLGTGGSRGSLTNLENTTKKLIVAHSHVPRKIRNSIQVGTCSNYDMSYNKGPSAWLHNCCVVYPGGTMQMINSINGTFTISDEQAKKNLNKRK